MKYLTGILLFLLVQTAIAGQCRVDGGTWIDVFDGSISVTVPIRATPEAGRIDFNGYRLECRYTPDGRTPSRSRDYWDTIYPTFVAGPKLARYQTGLRINNQDYPHPVPIYIRVAEMQDNRVGVDLQTYMYILLSGSPGNPINIRAGDRLATITFRQTNNTGNPRTYVTVILNAGNDLIVKPSTCTINGDRAIDVNFNQVDQSRIGENPASTAIQKIIRLTYTCPDPRITMPITITLKGLASSFNSGVLRMSNPNLGVGLLRGGALVGLDRSFRTNIYNSVGADDVIFSLIRRPGTVPATGAFSGSATLVMGVP